MCVKTHWGGKWWNSSEPITTCHMSFIFFLNLKIQPFLSTSFFFHIHISFSLFFSISPFLIFTFFHLLLFFILFYLLFLFLLFLFFSFLFSYLFLLFIFLLSYIITIIIFIIIFLYLFLFYLFFSLFFIWKFKPKNEIKFFYYIIFHPDGIGYWQILLKLNWYLTNIIKTELIFRQLILNIYVE